MQLADLLYGCLGARRDQVAVEFDAADGELATLTFDDLHRRSNRMARVLTERGCCRGDRLCVLLPNGIGFIDVFLACIKIGVIVAPINVLYREREVAHIVGDAGPRAVVTAAGMFDVVPARVSLWNLEELTVEADAMPADSGRVAIEGDDPAALIYTSGTTGRSKGAILSHNNFLANAANLLSCWRISADDRYLAVLPLFHVHGLANGIVCWLASGCRMRLVERFDAARVVELFSTFRPTLFFGVPTVYVRLLDLPADVAETVGRQVRLFVSGSAPLASSVFEAFREKFGHAILERYGMSETLMNISNPYGGERRPGSVGFPLPGVSTRIVTSDGHDAGIDEIGELLVRGPNVFLGYWRQPEATAAAFVDGWFKTGDLADRSSDGYYTLRGRRSDLIISGGFNIYPREIEDLLLEQAGVREVAVVGAGDARRGEVPVAYLVADQPIDPAALERTCRRELASFKVPRGFVQVDALPRTALGKVQKHLLPPWKRVVS